MYQKFKMASGTTQPKDASLGNQEGTRSQPTSVKQTDTAAKSGTVDNDQSNEQRQRDFEEMESNVVKYKDEKDVIQKELNRVSKELEKTKGLLKSKEDEVNQQTPPASNEVLWTSTRNNLKPPPNKQPVNRQYDTVTEKKIDKLERDLKTKTEQYDNLQSEYRELEKKFLKKTAQTDKLSIVHEKTMVDLKRTSGVAIDQTLSNEITRLHEELNQMKIENLEQKTEIDNWKLRLSKVAGERMVDGNTSITDLSDKYRPQKLSEMFVSLYDDTWTDAFEHVEIENGKERNICRQLLEIFQKCWEFCLQYSKDQLETLQLSFHNAEVNEEKTKILDNYPSHLTKLIKDTRRCFAQEFLSSLQQLYWKQNGTNFSEFLRPYVCACLEICWHSAISDPALHYVFTADNLEDFRPFTQGGSDVDYVVWPAMHLHEFGPLLMKGVVQFKK